MTLPHFVNCALLTFGPPWVLYHARLGMEHGAWRCLKYGALAYAAALLLRVLVLATLAPPSAPVSGGVDWLQEALRLMVSGVDAVAMDRCLGAANLQGDTATRVLALALGWTVADSVTLRLVPLWVGGRGPAFQWDHLRSALDATLALALNVAFVAAAVVHRRPPPRRPRGDDGAAAPAPVPSAAALVALRCALPSLATVLGAALGLGPWAPLLLLAAAAGPYCLLVHRRFALLDW